MTREVELTVRGAEFRGGDDETDAFIIDYKETLQSSAVFDKEEEFIINTLLLAGKSSFRRY